MLKFLKVSLGLTIISIVIILALEFTLRALGYNYSTVHIMYDKYCYWRMAPRQRMQDKDEQGNKITFTINTLGSRDKNFPIKKALGEKRIICVGDSYTYGWGVDDTATFPAYLQSLIDRDSLKIRVINFGCNGHTILHEANLIEKYGLALSPDYVIVETSLNTDFQDIDELEYRIGYMPVPGYNFIKYVIRKTAIGNVMLRCWNSRKVKDLIARRKQLKAEMVKEDSLSKEQADHKQAEVREVKETDFSEETIAEEVKSAFDIYVDKLDDFVALSKENGFKIIYLIMPHHTDGLDEYQIESEYLSKGNTLTARQYYEFLKNRYGQEIILIELMSHFNSRDLFLSDWHLNSKGNKLSAQIVYQAIKQELGR